MYSSVAVQDIHFLLFIFIPCQTVKPSGSHHRRVFRKNWKKVKFFGNKFKRNGNNFRDPAAPARRVRPARDGHVGGAANGEVDGEF